MKTLLDELLCWVEFVIFGMPGRLGNFLRGLYVRWRAGNLEGKVAVAAGSRFSGLANMKFSKGVGFGERCMLHSEAGKIKIGENSKFNSGVLLGADYGLIQIGSDVLVGPNVIMRASNHRFDKTPDVLISKQDHDYGEIIIGNDVWIGAHVTIIAGSEIGDHCVIGAGAVVNSKIPACSVAVGVPAKVFRTLAGSVAKKEL